MRCAQFLSRVSYGSGTAAHVTGSKNQNSKKASLLLYVGSSHQNVLIITVCYKYNKNCTAGTHTGPTWSPTLCMVTLKY